MAASGERRGAGNGVVVEVEEESRAAELTATHKMEAGRRERKDNTRGDKDWIGVLWPLGRPAPRKRPDFAAAGKRKKEKWGKLIQRSVVCVFDF